MRTICIATLTLLFAAAIATDLHAIDEVVIDDGVSHFDHALFDSLCLVPGHEEPSSVCLHVSNMEAVLIITEDIAFVPPQDESLLVLYFLDADLDKVVCIILMSSVTRARGLVLPSLPPSLE